MKGFLDKPKLEYVLFHLSCSIKLSDEIKNKFHFSSFSRSNNERDHSIYFPLVENDLDIAHIFYINDLPVLFPCDKEQKKWFSVQNGNIVFHHDILKSAFYLLSGYQELNKNHYDELGRYNYKFSIQNQLSIVHKPLVNYYLEIVMDAISEYCKIHNLPFQKKSIFDSFCFMLTHDVDRVDKYHFWEVALKIQQKFGLKPNPYPTKKILNKVVIDYVLNSLFLKNSVNDFWNFEYLRELEKKRNLTSVFYFLDKEGLHENSRYQFSEKRIKSLLETLISESCEIGLHGTTFSFNSKNFMRKCKDNLQNESSQKIVGNRQHYLKFDRILTPQVLIDSGIRYDSTLGFPQHEGFRNSYCLPFKVFDFVNNTTSELWELPLNVMDGTLFYYRKLNYEQMFESVKGLIHEIQKFNGLFTLLWHNSHFDENEFPGIHGFYEELLNLITSYSPMNLTGIEILDRLNSNFTE